MKTKFENKINTPSISRITNEDILGHSIWVLLIVLGIALLIDFFGPVSNQPPCSKKINSTQYITRHIWDITLT